MSLQNLGEIELDIGNAAPGIALHQEGLELAEHLGDLASAGFGRVSLGEGHTMLGRYRRAEDELHAALATFEDMDDQLGLGFVSHALGDLALARDQDRQAFTHFRRALAHWSRIGNRRGVVIASEGIALALDGLGRHRLARTILSETDAAHHTEQIGCRRSRARAVAQVLERDAADGGLPAPSIASGADVEATVRRAIRTSAMGRHPAAPRRGQRQFRRNRPISRPA